ncbi:ATPase P [Nitritalea halalkaliphila LW7]|uniref:ATPase P n=2 Tax=Nitritalea TaxID=1187887 RepID=I5C4D9_9BACT|nr:ATPase P [Nitritalea halalkaliphila LW7]
MGMSASVLCMIHCLAVPVLISAGYFFNHVGGDEANSAQAGIAVHAHHDHAHHDHDHDHDHDHAHHDHDHDHAHHGHSHAHHGHAHAHSHGSMLWHALDYVFILIALFAVYSATKKAHSKGIKITLWSAVIVFSIGVLLHDWKPEMIFVSLAASFVLVIGHYLNWKQHGACEVDHSHS